MFKAVSRICVLACLASFLVGTAAGQSGNAVSASVVPPVLGFVVDNNYGLRPMIGIPGAASIGSPLNLRFEVLRAAAPPGNDYVLAMTSESSWPRLLRFRGSAVTQAIDLLDNRQRRQQAACDWPPDAPGSRQRGILECLGEPSAGDSRAKIDRIALSPSGSSAALFTESLQRFFVFTNLPQSPSLTATFEIKDLGPLTAFAVSDDGRTVLVGVSGEATGSVFLFAAGQPVRWIGSIRHPSAITFLHRSDGAFIADDQEDVVYSLFNGQLATVAAGKDGISGPIAIAVSNDNQRVFAANFRSGSVTTIGPNGSIAEPRLCDCAITGLHPTNTDAVFRLTDFSGGPVLLFDGRSDRPRFIFIPVYGAPF